jgi:hypothetical protein
MRYSEFPATLERNLEGKKKFSRSASLQRTLKAFKELSKLPASVRQARFLIRLSAL